MSGYSPFHSNIPVTSHYDSQLRSHTRLFCTKAKAAFAFVTFIIQWSVSHVLSDFDVFFYFCEQFQSVTVSRTLITCIVRINHSGLILDLPGRWPVVWAWF